MDNIGDDVSTFSQARHGPGLHGAQHISEFLRSSLSAGLREPGSSGTVSANMRFSSLLCFIALAGGLFLAPHPTHAANLPLSAVVRVEVRATRTNQLLGSGTGLTIDPDGHVLVSNAILDPTAKDPHVSLSLCPTKIATDAPDCWLKAAIIRRNTNLGLALLQITSLHVGDAWISPEEHVIRTGFRFSYHTPALENQTREDVSLGESLSALQYGASPTSSIREQMINVTGFLRQPAKKGTAPNLVQFSPKLADRTGGVAFNASGTFVGFLSGQEKFASIPLVNRFLKEALGTEYLQRKTRFVLTNEFIGTQNGLLSLRTCPAYATADSGSGLCRCNTGFFAIGNSCMTGNTYCGLVYPQRGTYDAFAKSCVCHNTQGAESCSKPAALNKPAPKPVSPTGPSSSLSSTPFYCPLNAHYDASSWSCLCNTSYTKNKEKTACIPLK